MATPHARLSFKQILKQMLLVPINVLKGEAVDPGYVDVKLDGLEHTAKGVSTLFCWASLYLGMLSMIPGIITELLQTLPQD